MNESKRKKLEAAGWKVGSASDFLELTDAEETIVNMKLNLSAKVKELRQEMNITQEQLAKRIGSSQSRVAKIETADPSVSLDLIVRSMASLGMSQKEIGNVIISKSAASRKKPVQRTKPTKPTRRRKRPVKG